MVMENPSRGYQCGYKNQNHGSETPSCSMFAAKDDSGVMNPVGGGDSAPKRKRAGRRAGSRRRERKAGKRRTNKRSYKTQRRARKPKRK